MRGLVFVALAAMSIPAVAQNAAPFCLVNQFGGASCFYYSLDACRTAQSSMGGMCTANPANVQRQQPQQVQPSYYQPTPVPYPATPAKGVSESFAEGYERGARMRRERELHQAQMQVLQAQADAAKSQVSAAPALISPPATGRVLYRCPQADGTPLYTTTAAVNCVVIAVQ